MRRYLAVLATTAITFLCWTTPGYADIHQPAVVSEDPVDWTPNVLDGQVNAIAVVGSTVVVGGNFARIAEAGSRQSYYQPYIFAFDSSTGRLVDFRPNLDGPVNSLVAGPDNTVYAGGGFRVVNDERRRGVVRLNLSNGEITDGFEGTVGNGEVKSMELHRNALYVAGTFTYVGGRRQNVLARLDSRTGWPDPSFDVEVAAPNHPRVKIEDTALSPDGQRLVIIGEITQVNGQPRSQLALLNVGGGRPTVDPWYTLAYDAWCHRSFDTYVRAVDFSPTGSYFVVVTTGAVSGPQRMCDTAARFDPRGSGAHDPTWVNHTGGDTLTAVSVTGTAVYVGGHQRWMSNPYGRNFAGRGAIPRIGIAALDPRDGSVLAWNPTRLRGKGVGVMVATDYGLYVGSDTNVLGREYHGKLGMFPLHRR
ncbi:delta-60 repeat domain-containing protein [Luedemannella helvata]|uniref:PKD domain containing protein n=1 Tax=Luedemannella helvata TaxID=349315 RepID=A0ABN2JQY5_9ACTN